MSEGEQQGVDHTRSRKKKGYLFAAMIAAILLLPLGVYLVFGRTSKQDALPHSVTAQVSAFKPYYFKGNQPPDNLRLKPDTANYSEGLLVFSLITDKGESIALTEQAVPADFANSTLQGDESLNTAAGRATISTLEGGRTTASLLTKDKTFILLNTNDPVELSTIKDVLRSLIPIQ